jgi:ABC-2 type transport system permease protein
MIALLRTEWGKTLRRPRTYVAMAFVVVIPVIIAFALWANPPSGGDDGPRFFSAATQTGLLFPAAALNIMSRLLLIVVIGLFAGEVVAGEASSGNLRYVLLRPIGRGRLLTAKLIIAASLALLTTIFLAGTATIAGGLFFGFKPIHAPFFADQSVGNLLIHTGMATGYVTWALASVVAFGFMVSTMSDSPAAAAGAAVGLGVTSEILNEITALGAIRDWLPLRYFDAWTGLYWSDRVPDDMWRGLLQPVPFVLGFGAIAWWWFRRKDILS